MHQAVVCSVVRLMDFIGVAGELDAFSPVRHRQAHAPGRPTTSAVPVRAVPGATKQSVVHPNITSASNGT